MRGRKHFLPHAMSRESSGILCDWDVSNSNSPEYSSSESSGSFSALTAALSRSAIPLSTVPPPSTSAQARPISAIHSSLMERPAGFWEETDMVPILPGIASTGKDSDGEWDHQRSEVCAPSTRIFRRGIGILPYGSTSAGAAGPTNTRDIRQSRRSLPSARIVLGNREEVHRLQADVQTRLNVAQAFRTAPIS
jgi:hypothetical protein